MRKLDIILDSDGVCVNTMKKVLKVFNKEYGTNYILEDIISGNLNKIDFRMNDIFDIEKFFVDIEPVFEAQKYIKKLREDGHNIFICTASPRNAIEDKFVNLTTLFNLPNDVIIPITHKRLLKGDIMLDDGIHNLITSICDYKFLFDWPWNRDKDGFERIYSWEEFYNKVCAIATNSISLEQVI